MEVQSSKIKIMVVDDHDIMRAGLISLLKEEPAFEIIGQAGNGKETLSFLTYNYPDVILLDVNMPIMNGRETLMNIMKYHPTVKVIMLTFYKGYVFEQDYRELGAYSFLDKGIDYEELCTVIKSVSKGRYYYYTDKNNIHVAALCDKHLQLSLNEIEHEIIKLLCDDKNNTHISKALNLSIYNTRYYRRTIYSKTGTSTIAGLVKYSIRNGIIGAE